MRKTNGSQEGLNIFALRLKELISVNGYIHEDIAKAIGVTRQGVGNWVNGVSVPDVLTAAKLANFFNVSLDYLVGNTSVQTNEPNLKAICEYTGLNEKAVTKLSDIKKHVECGMTIQPQILTYLSYIIEWDIESFVTNITCNYTDLREKEDEKYQLNDTLKDFSYAIINSSNPELEIKSRFATMEKIDEIEEEIALIEFKNTRCFNKLLESFYDFLDDISADEVVNDMLENEEGTDNGEHKTPKE